METQTSARGGARDLHKASLRREDKLANGLGLFSLVLGGTQLAAPGLVAGVAGVRSRPSLMRSLGVREILSGALVLRGQHPRRWLVARTLGDVMDLMLLGFALRRRRRNKRVVTALASVAGVMALDALSSARATRAARDLRRGAHVVVNRSLEECYQAWTDLAGWPRFFGDIGSFVPVADKRWQWLVQEQRGEGQELEVVEQEPGRIIRLTMSPNDGAPVSRIIFEKLPAERGTLIRLFVEGRISRAHASLFGPAETRVALARFKQLLETGEITTTSGQPSGARSLRGRTLLKGVMS